MNRQSNTYTVIYATVLVLLVGVGLSVVYQALRPKQEENIANDVKRQILASALITPGNGESIGELYDRHIKNSFIVNDKGEVIPGNPLDVNVSAESKKEPSERKLPVFECSTSAGMKYIVPVYGAGLWVSESPKIAGSNGQNFSSDSVSSTLFLMNMRSMEISLNEEAIRH